ncbi:MAG: penicillin-binding protein 2 [Gammaproteobacteria bacterium]|nr:MAG: penicillin-binding protein 2 [Gammaproteobacteria bacterium]
MAAVRIKDHWAEQRLFLTRLVVAASCVGILTAVVLTRLVQLQIVQYDYFSAQSQGNRIRIEPVPATRGLILDRNGRVLAENQASFGLELTPEQVPDIDDTLRRLADLGLLKADELPEIRRRINARRRFDTIAIREHLNDEEVALFAVKRPYFDGVEIRARLSRFYPYGPALAHALGYVGGISADDQREIDAVAYAGTSHIGKVSVERAFERELHGNVGREQVLVNARGRSLQTLERQSALPGQDLVLGLDLDAQLAAWAGLAGRRGAVVAIDPANGEVLTFVSSPAFDPNAISAGLSRKAYSALLEDIDKPLLNRALRGTYPPGSTIKPIIALAGLAEGVTTAEERVACRGYFMLPGSQHRYRDWKPEGHGMVDLYSSIEQSCDVYYYTLARNLGIERMAAYLSKFGLGGLTGIELPGERGGLVPTPAWKRRAFSRAANQVWFPGETVIAGIGQGYLLVTPLQLATATATIAARGQRFEPTMLHALRDPITGTVTPVTAGTLAPVTVPDAAYWDHVIEGMHRVMQGARGTARAVGLNAPFQMAGKSGTAQVFSIAQNEKYKAAEVAERLRDHALFVAFAPLEQPRIAVAVVIENGESGSKIAAPIARQVMEAYLRKGGA